MSTRPVPRPPAPPSVPGASREGEEPVTFRPMTTTDVEAVAAIEREAFSTPWSASTFRELVEAGRVQLRVAENGAGEVVGYTVLWAVGDEAELANIAVRAEDRGKGIGRRLLDDVLEVARRRGVRTVFLEVRESNHRAAGMYLRRGFRQVGTRRNYYTAPRENARVLAKRLDP